MQRVYVGVDLGSSSFQQVGVNEPGMVVMKREFQTSAAHLVKAVSASVIAAAMVSLCGGRGWTAVAVAG